MNLISGHFRQVLAALAAAAQMGVASGATVSAMSAAEADFRSKNACPATGFSRGPCKGYVVDRIVPPICGGAEAASNMQWQTVAQARAKDRWERIGCRPGRTLVLPGPPSFSEAYPMSAPAAPKAEPLSESPTALAPGDGEEKNPDER